jgi:tyrosinase
VADEIVLRPDVEHADIAALRDAYAKLQGFSATDNRSWVYWGEYHGFNRYDCWHAGRTGPAPATRHSYDLFLPWHRAYLLNFDHIAREQNPQAILPWWDWTSELSHQVGVPPSYTEAETGGKPNPLASGTTPDMPGDPARRTRRFPGDPAELPSTENPDPALGLPSIKFILGLSSYVDFSNQLQNVHDQIHGWVGGVSPDDQNLRGDMGSIPTAAYDPIFWAHHVMIDRLWYLWQLEHGVNNIPNDYLEKVLAPFSVTVRQVLDVRQLGYDYASSVVVAAGGTGANSGGA